MSSPRYSLADRILYGMAFGGIEIQKEISLLEDRAFAKSLSAVRVQPPVFITSLPRSGTTLLLQLIAEQHGQSSHTYRDMPFLLCPLLWSQVSMPFWKPGGLGSRAHGDGMMIEYDSVEAFEEILWRAFWPGKYRNNVIELWDSTDRNDEFARFYVQHMRKIVLLRGDESGKKSRYVSKNNWNVARIPWLRAQFPNSPILVPFRNPFDHASSLLMQHVRFSQLHVADPFKKRYMSWLGHDEFGAQMRPIGFHGEQYPQADGPRTFAYWLHYWNAAFKYIMTVMDEVILLDYDRCCEEPSAPMKALSDVLDLPLAHLAHRFRAGTSYSIPQLDEGLVGRAKELHRALRNSTGQSGVRIPAHLNTGGDRA